MAVAEECHYRISDICQIVRGTMIAATDTEMIISDLLIDSRKFVTANQTLFFALTSQRNDGHKFIAELFKKGIRNFLVVRAPKNIHLLKGANIILAPDVLVALQSLAASHRQRFSLPVIGITGSNGKTIVKEWLYQLISKDRNMVRSPKSYNSQIGVPLSVWQLHPNHDLALFEAGISQPDEMEQLRNIIRPDIGIFTNIGQAHDENFLNTQQKIDEKLTLFIDAKTIIYCSDHEAIHKHIARDIVLSEKQLFTWGNSPEANLQIISKKRINDKTDIKGLFRNETLSFTIPFTDSASIENALHCAALMLLLGYDPVIIKERMLTLCPVAMRLELKEGINGCSIINDSYSSDIKSLSIALDFLNQQKQHPIRTVILSDILQSGREIQDLFTEVASLLEGQNVDKLIGIGPEISSQHDLFSMQKLFYADTQDFINRFDLTSFQNEAILLKGARKFAFEKISRILQQKTHETILEINLDALIHNLNYYRSMLQPGTKVMAMVKAFSYGSGSYEIASLLQYHHTDYLSVAYVDEGYELRKAGITLPIMVMNADEQSVETLLRYDLEPEIYSFRVLALLEEAINNFNGGLSKPVKIHIKVDTGMHRLGFELQDLDKLAKQLMENPMITIGSVFSHLAASEARLHDDFSRYQIELFKKMNEKICSQFDYKILCHILNSAGISRFPEAQFDMVRLGISLYGIASVENEQHSLEHVSTLRSTISQIKKVPANETIGYNRQWKATKDMIIAIVPIGYADGLSRRLSNGIGKLFINGHPAPVVGNVCMDMCMVDISGIQASEGDEVIVFSKDHPITELAHDLGTIPYEVLTGISRRVKRVYYQE